MSYKCAICGETHEDWPVLAYRDPDPDPYYSLPEAEKQTIAQRTDDVCVIRYPNHTDYFIRTVMIQQVNDWKDNLEYGLWVSLSEKSYYDYIDHWDDPNHEAGYFGWLCNTLPQYTFEKSIPMNVFGGKGNKRPFIEPHQEHDHQFVRDYYNGISKEEAERRIHHMTNN